MIVRLNFSAFLSVLAAFGVSLGGADDFSGLRNNPPISTTSLPVAGSAPIRFNGYVLSDGHPLFNLSDANGKWLGWFAPNTPRNGITVMAHDPLSMTVTLQEEGRPKLVTLSFSTGVVHEQIPSASALALAVGSERKEIPAGATPQSEMIASALMPQSPVELPPVVRAMMFPTGKAKPTDSLSHPADAAPYLGDSNSTIPPDVARFFPAKPAPLWQHADPARNTKSQDR